MLLVNLFSIRYNGKGNIKKYIMEMPFQTKGIKVKGFRRLAQAFGSGSPSYKIQLV